jgi:hypothetical protein
LEPKFDPKTGRGSEKWRFVNKDGAFGAFEGLGWPMIAHYPPNRWGLGFQPQFREFLLIR